ncbi:MAG: hypothetical protein DRN95_01940, partial [Candidatus Hydrothermarchaeota archaeon]
SDDNVMTILFVQSELSTSPAIVDVFDKPFVSPVLLDRQSNSAIAVERCDNNDRITTLCFGKLSGARNVKSDWNLVELLASLQVLPYLMYAINEDLRMQIIFLLDNRIGGVV